MGSANSATVRRYPAPIHSRFVFTTLHLLRHGEVRNPAAVVYADLPGFGLSVIGAQQAAAAARMLATEPIAAIVSSPLLRARQTAAPLARITGVPVDVDSRLTEWGLGGRWAGAPWDALPRLFPGELEAYLATPTDLPFAPESIAQVAARMVEAVETIGQSHPDGVAVVVSHQDPVQALRLVLTGRNLADLHTDKPSHASIVTLERTSSGWSETRLWSPDARSAPFPPLEPTEAT